MQGPAPEQLAEWRNRLWFLAYEAVGRARIAQFFDIVVEHPDSLPAVKDLRACLAHTSLEDAFIHSFQAAIHHRLLHAGEPCACYMPARARGPAAKRVGLCAASPSVS